MHSVLKTVSLTLNKLNFKCFPSGAMTLKIHFTLVSGTNWSRLITTKFLYKPSGLRAALSYLAFEKQRFSTGLSPTSSKFLSMLAIYGASTKVMYLHCVKMRL